MLDIILWYAHVWGTLGLFFILALCGERLIHEMEKRK